METREVASLEDLGENEILLLDALQTTVGDDVALLRRLLSCFGEVRSVTHVHRHSDGKPCVKVVFDSRRSAELCVARIVQTEVATECFHRGFVFLGYYRFLVEGRPPRKRERDEQGASGEGSMLTLGAADAAMDERRPPKHAPHSEPSAPTQQQALLLLRMTALPDNGVMMASLDSLSPYMIYQMLRDSCFPTRVVLCKKKGGEVSGSARHDTRQALVQVDRAETAAAVTSAFNGTVVEFVDGSNASAPRFLKVKVWACEAKRDASRPERNELNVPVNVSGAMCVTRQSIGKIGGVFDRRWLSNRTALPGQLPEESRSPSTRSCAAVVPVPIPPQQRECWERVFSAQYQRHYYVVSGGSGAGLRTTWDEPPVEAFMEGRVRL